MVFVLPLLLIYALLTFGAVLPHSWFLLVLCWIIALTFLGVVFVIRRHVLPTRILALLVSSVLLLIFADNKTCAALLSLGWAWAVFEDQEQALRFLRVVVAIGVLESCLAFYQAFIAPGWIFGYQSSGRVSGSLINPNHFAGLLGMIIPLGLGLAYISIRRDREIGRCYTYLLLCAFMGIAVTLTLSRMGIVAVVGSLLMMGVLMQARARQQGLSLILISVTVGLLLLGSLWIGVDTMVHRYALLLDRDAILQEARIPVFRDTIRLILTNPLGIGSHKYVDVFRTFQTFHPEGLFEHVHNDYLESAVEWGIPIAVLFWTAIMVILIQCIRAYLHAESIERAGIMLGCVGSTVAILFYSLTDFNLQIPSNAMLFFSLLGVGASLAFGREIESRSNLAFDTFP